MKRLSKEQVKEHEELVDAVNGAHQELDGAIKQYNERVAAAHSELAPFVEAFNEAVTKANDFRESVHSDQQAYFDEKSEKWQEGDAGSAYSDWMSQWDEAAIEEVELDDAPEMDTPDLELNGFDQLETECPS